jgi:CheY-like chemotaxis protein
LGFIKKYFVIDVVKDAQEALEIVRKNTYEAVLMDIGLGLGMNGVDLSKEIRKVKGYENIPIIAVTAFATQKDRDFMLSHGLDYYISKPFLREDILEVINEALDNK